MSKYKIIAMLLILFLNVSMSYSQKNGDALGGEYIHKHTENCVSDNDYIRISKMLSDNILTLRNLGLIQTANKNQVVKFGFPLKKVDSLEWNNYYGISGFVDQIAGTGVRDYTCGTRTYDGHNGVDYFTWPFQWYLVENELVHIVAAADGIIIGKDDGNSSYSCDWNGNQNWNAVYLLHNDGSSSWYGHMKENSLTDKQLGSVVLQGEYLGVVGSSGRSTGPHLHFEVYKSDPFNRSNLIEPHFGDCNDLNNESWWESQGTYQKATLNTILTHDDDIELGCPTVNEKTNFQNDFKPGDRVYFSRFYKDQKLGTTSIQRIYRPNGTLWNQWQQNFNENYDASWWYNYYTLPTNAESGEWKYEAVYEGTTLRHTFNVIRPSNTEDDNYQNSIEIRPNPTSGIVKVFTSTPEESQNMDLNIRSITGKVLVSKENILIDQEIQIDDLPKGIHLMEIRIADKFITKKLIIQ
jgi:Peptidase family M23/Secretion system C-terminal sorting domain